MAVYLVSLQWLAGQAAKRANHVARSAGAVASSAGPDSSGAIGNGTQGAGEASPRVLAPGTPAPNDLAGVMDGLLGLPGARIEQLLSKWGESGAKALLVLIHRLAAVETQLADLKARVGITPAAPAVGGHIPGTQICVATKTDLLEQVYRKNLSLRRVD